MSAEPTPGPWRLQMAGAHEADLINGGTFAGINGGRGCPDVLDADDQATWEANARLIAAAPDLLAALEAACGYLLNAKIDLETGAPKRTAINTIEGGLTVTRDAIAKARGA